MVNWDERFHDMAKMVASWSKDTNTKVGAIIVDQDNIVLSMGYNGFPRGCNDDIPSRYEQPEKYLYTEHAERNCIYQAGRYGVSLKNSSMYVTMFTCADCARAIIQCGITKVIAPTPDINHKKWGAQFKAALNMFKEAKINVKLL